MTPGKKANILLVGGGAVGTIVALNIESGGLGAVTAVLRSNFSIVQKQGYTIESVDHGKIEGWRPTAVVNQVPNVQEESLPPFDYIITTTKNYPDIPPTLPDLIAPAVTPGHTAIVMIQNGLNIENPVFEKFPENIVLSGVSFVDSHEGQSGEIFQEDHDILQLGAFDNPNITDKEIEASKAREFVKIYGAAGKTDVKFSENVAWSRWRKLVINAVLNPLCAVLRMDTARVRLADSLVDNLVRPAMQEIFDTAAKLGYQLPDDIIETMVNFDPMDLYLKPSMQCDIEKGNYMEVEFLVGEPLREAEKAGVPTPNLRVIYEICKALQWKTKEERGLVTVPPKRKA